MAKLMRYVVLDETKYFCLFESTAFYLQKYVQYRKRKIFVSDQDFGGLVQTMKKHNGEQFLFACSSVHKSTYPRLLDENGIKYNRAVFYRTVPCDMKHIDLSQYDMLVFFSPIGVDSLFNNFPDFKQNATQIACYGSITAKAIRNHGLKLTQHAPTLTAPSMAMALEEYLCKLSQAFKA